MTIALLGGGMMGESLLSGLLAAGRSAGDIVVAERYADRAAFLKDSYGVEVREPAAAVAGADVVVVAVKPPDVVGVLAAVGPSLASDTVVVSVAAGLTLAALEAPLPDGTAVVRVMPNTPVRVREAMSALSAGSYAREEHLLRAEELLAAVGRTVRVPEALQDAVTALSGSGPAYFLYVIEALIDAGVQLGLPRSIAAELVGQTAYGTAVLLKESGDHPALLREAVTSPGGTTARGLRALDEHGLRAALQAAAQAAHDRSKELGS
jgi:pyrroline-5-carboxylate reductase